MAGFDTVADAGTPPQGKAAQGDGQPPDISALLHSTIGLRSGDTVPGASHLKSTALTLTGLDVPLHPVTTVPDAPRPPFPVGAPKPIETGSAGPAKNCDQSQPKPQDTDTESKVSKLIRETAVVGGGLGRSFLYGMASLPQRAPEIGASVAIGATLSTISKTGELGTAATVIVGAYFSSKFIVNAINDTPRWNKLSAAVSDAWHSDQHTMKDLRDFSDSGGNFAFDTTLSYTSGYIGYKNKALADLILSVIKVPLPGPIVPGIPPKFPLTPSLVGAAPYLASFPAPFLYKHHPEDDSSKKSDDK